MRLACRALGVFALLSLSVSPLQAQSCDGHPLALVLSGGGAKGLAHIGVLEVLDSLGIRPDLIVGSSIGSVVGALYASGYSGRAIDSLARALQLQNIVRRDLPRAPRVIGTEQPLLIWEQGAGKFEFRQGTVHEVALNAKLNAALLRGNLAARGNFDSLPVPFRAVATDLSNRQAVILRGGDLAHAVRASMSIPLFLHPQTIDGQVLADGGLIANVPVGVARDEGARRVIVSDVGGRLGDSLNVASPFALIDQLIGFLFNQPRDSLLETDRRISPDVEGFGTLDFAPVRLGALIDRGYRAAGEALADYPCKLAGPLPFPEPLPAFRIAHASAVDAKPRDASALIARLGVHPGARLSIPDLRDRLGELAELENFEEVWINPTGSPDSLDLKLTIRPSPPRLAAAGIGYDSDIGGRAWLGLIDRGATLSRVEGSALLNLDELRQGFSISLRPTIVGGRPLRPVVTLLAGGESVLLYSANGSQHTSQRNREVRGFLGVERELPGRGVVALGGVAYAWDVDVPGETGAGVDLSFASGPRYQPSGAFSQLTLASTYTRFQVEAKQAITLRHLSLIPEVRYGIGDRLPAHLTFMLGGYDGFPGLHIGERRAEHEILLRLTGVQRLTGPFSLRIQGATGQVSDSGGALPSGDWLLGARAGLGVDTPIGLVRIEYGRNTDGRGQFFVRIGERY